LNFYIHDLATSFRVELEGDLSGKAAVELEQLWRTACSVIGDRPLVIALGNVNNIHPAGDALLQKLHQAGARFVAKSPSAEALVTTITGQQIPSKSGSGDHVCPRFRAFAFLVMLLVTLLFPATAIAAHPTVRRRSGAHSVSLYKGNLCHLRLPRTRVSTELTVGTRETGTTSN
jgi:hypothetical protein